MKSLIIVESPSKAKTIKNFLGSSYDVVASKGHIRDLPKRTMGIKFDGDSFELSYEVDKTKSAIVSDLKQRAKQAKDVLIATDEDREGEAIGFHIATILGKDVQSYPRIVFHEVTKEAIKHSLQNPRSLDLNKVNAQQARRALDRLVGYNLSPLISSKIQRGLSAGRVQSSSLKIIVDKEKEIQNFKPVEFYTISAVFDGSVFAQLSSYGGKTIEKLSVKTQKEADEIYKTAKSKNYKVQSVETRTKKVQPNPPFMTSTLQQTASTILGFSPKRTMQIAQKLYEGVKTPKGTTGLITYMRTDSLNINAKANEDAREKIKNDFGTDYLSEKTRIFKSKAKGAQEAHEAIRPTDLSLDPKSLEGFLSPEEHRLYTLIYNRFLATQMKDALFESMSVLIAGDDVVFKASGSRLVFAGFYKVVGDQDKDKLLPKLEKNQALKLTDLEAKQNFTQPPARYSESSLVKMLESLGIGRPSTYAPTISTLEDRGYIEIEKKQIIPTEVAFKVISVLELHFPHIVDSNFTAKMEEELDKIEEEKKDWQKILKDFYAPFIEDIQKGKTEIKSQKVLKETDEFCPLCGSNLVIRSGRFGEFVSCSAYPKCKYSKNIGEKEPELTDKICDLCGGFMVIKNGKRGKFYACSNYPTCKNTKPLNPPKELDQPCPKCGKKLVERFSKRGKFYGCSGYPDCNFLTKYPLSDTKCEECGGVMVKKELKLKNTLECLDCKHVVDLTSQVSTSTKLAKISKDTKPTKNSADTEPAKISKPAKILTSTKPAKTTAKTSKATSTKTTKISKPAKTAKITTDTKPAKISKPAKTSKKPTPKSRTADA